jgi:murein DD-endopeptidase MepM/ murein hydrolase activator NlpD
MSRFKINYVVLLLSLFYTITFAQTNEAVLISHPGNLSVSSNGKFFHHSLNKTSKANSENGNYCCDYDIGNVCDEYRELLNFKFYEKNQLLFSIEKAPGSDLYISNEGFIAFINHEYHFKQEIIVIFYSKYGNHLFTQTLKSASLFGFSEKGNFFGVGTAENLFVFSLPHQSLKRYDSCDQFDISESGKYVTTAQGKQVKIYANGKLKKVIDTQFVYPRGIKVSDKFNFVVVSDKQNLKLFSLSNGNLFFAKRLKNKNSFRDLYIKDGEILTGVHNRYDGISKGFLQVYDLKGNLVHKQEQAKKNFKTFETDTKLKKPFLDYEKIPWPFFPFDSMRTVWNYYEQHMSYGEADWSYLHQGLDLIIPIGEPVYSTTDGIVKCVLTLGGAAYWRTAISAEQSAGYSDGWLYAHLIDSTIQVDVGDTVRVHDYLGDIIQWSSDWGHIHFVQIQDSGLVWRYDDNEWGINYNPLLSLIPDEDLIPPVIDNVFPNSKFGFCINETSNYLNPDSLFGDIDIITKVIDYIGDSQWQQPAFETYFWITDINGETVFPKTLGQRLNHSYNFYGSGNYEPYAATLYKRDEFLLPSRWMDKQRNYYHVLTNNNGDSLIFLAEKDLAFSTENYNDDDYRIFVEVRDAFGNSTVDSMDVKFCNGNISKAETENNRQLRFELKQNYPNPFNPTTKITFYLSEAASVKLSVYNILGEEVSYIIDKFMNSGTHIINFDASSLSAGMYFYQLKTGYFTQTRKMILLP